MRIDLFPAMEREAELKKEPNGDEVVLISDCTGHSIELYPWEIRMLDDWVRRNCEE